MSNETEQNVIKDEAKPKQARHFSWSGVFAFLSLAMSLVLIAGGVMLYQHMQSAHAEISAMQNALKQTDIASLRDNINATETTTKQLREDIDHVRQTVVQLSQADQANKDVLTTEQANYYVKMANDNIQYANNIPMAITLLKMADAEIQALNTAKLDNVRKALANDIAHLQSVPQVDVSGIYLRLNALDSQVNKLVLPTQTASANQNDTMANNTNETWWKRGLQSTWQALQKIVVVRYHPNGALPLITPDEQMYLMQNLHAMFAQTTWALLHGQAAIYQASLQQTTAWVKQYFSLDSSVTQAMLSELNQLQQMDIHPANPEITESLQAFAAIKQENK